MIKLIQNLELRTQNYNSKFKIFAIFSCIFAFYLLNFDFSPTTFAQSAICLGTGTPRAEGLVSTPILSGKFNTSTGACIIDEKAVLVTFKLPDYAELKSKYYTQAKSTSVVTKHAEVFSPSNLPNGQIDMGGTTSHLYSFSDNVTIGNPSNISGNNTGIIFVDKNLTIGPLPSNRLQFGNDSSGLVFVVGGDVSIDPTVDRIDGVVISSGTIYTAGGGCTISSVTTSSALTINGSLISLNPSSPMKFCRRLADNRNPAEIVNWQGKFLAVLKDIFSQTLEKWTEITVEPITSSSPPPSTPTCSTGYRDFDKDSFGVGPSGCWDSSPSYNIVSNSSDCYDSDANAKPGQTQYFSTPRGDGSWDWDCSGGISANANSYGTSCNQSESWFSNPSCRNSIGTGRRCSAAAVVNPPTGCGQLAVSNQYYCSDEEGCGCSSAYYSAGATGTVVGCR